MRRKSLKCTCNVCGKELKSEGGKTSHERDVHGMHGSKLVWRGGVGGRGAGGKGKVCGGGFGRGCGRSLVTVFYPCRGETASSAHRAHTFSSVDCLSLYGSGAAHVIGNCGNTCCSQCDSNT